MFRRHCLRWRFRAMAKRYALTAIHSRFLPERSRRDKFGSDVLSVVWISRQPMREAMTRCRHTGLYKSWKVIERVRTLRDPAGAKRLQGELPRPFFHCPGNPTFGCLSCTVTHADNIPWAGKVTLNRPKPAAGFQPLKFGLLFYFKPASAALARRANLRHKEANKPILWPKTKFLPKRWRNSTARLITN